MPARAHTTDRPSPRPGGERPERSRQLLATLEGLLRIQALALPEALGQASDLVAEALGAEKVDIFLLDPRSDSLVAVGTSDTPLARKQRALGLDRLPLANGGRAAKVYRTGEPFASGDVRGDPEELVGIVEALGVRATLMAPFDVDGAGRGVLSLTTTRADAFGADDLSFTEAAARWVGVLTHRARLVDQIARSAVEQGRRVAAEELMTVLAHDLRNQLSPLRGRLDLLRQRAAADGRARDESDAASALRAVRRFTRLIEDLMDVARLDQGLFALTPRPVNLVALAGEVAQSLAVPGCEVAVRGPQELVVEADPERLRQVLENLVANAVNHSPPGVGVTIEAAVVKREGGDAARVTVADQGPGIEPELLPRVFERFVAAASSRGLGLGLFLARRIAEAHRGELTVRSEPGAGTAFTLLLPLGGARGPA